MYWSSKSGHFFLSHLLITHERQLPVSRMISVKIVVTDIHCHVLLHAVPRRLVYKLQPLMFQASPEALHHRIVPTGSHISHAAPEAVSKFWKRCPVYREPLSVCTTGPVGDFAGYTPSSVPGRPATNSSVYPHASPLYAGSTDP